MNIRRFEHPTKHRFWEVYWEATDVEVVTGAIGSNGRAKQHDFTSHLDCTQFVEREIAKRAKEGFEEVVPEVVQSKQAPRAEPSKELIARILEAPDDDQPRMVYADWLQQQGDPLGELIAVQLEIARTPVPPKSLRDREDNLLGNFRMRWLPNVVGAEVTFVRGFAERVKLELPFERAVLDRIVEIAPLIRTLVLAHPHDAWRWTRQRPWELASADALRRFSGIWMGGFELGGHNIEALVQLDLPKLDRLGLRAMQLLPVDLKPLRGRAWVELDVHANNLGARGLGVILDGDVTKLSALAIGSNDVMNAGLQMLATAKPPALATLSLRRSKLTPTGLPLLASLPALATLDLSCNKLGQAFDFALPALRELDVRECELDDDALRALLRAFGKQLVSLDIGSNRVASPYVLLEAELPALRTLNISNNPLTTHAQLLKDRMPAVRFSARAKRAKEGTSWS